MKTTFDSKELPHIWVHRQAKEGRCAQATSFSGDSYYSYSLKIGKRITHKGKTAYLLLHTGVSSVTTSKHQNHLGSAIPGADTVFYCSGELDEITGAKLFKQSLRHAATAAIRAERAISCRAEHLAAQANWLRQAESVAKYFGLKSKVPGIQTILASLKKAEALETKRKEAAQRKAEADAQDAVNRWLAGEAIGFPSVIQRCYVRKEGDELVTSRGARVPLKDARRAFGFAVSKRAESWRRNGEAFEVGGYQLDAINAEGIVAGCTRIGWDEIERFAKSEGWTA